MSPRVPCAALFALCCSFRSLPARRIAPDTPEPGSVEEIARGTTEARFLSPWVSYLPASASVVSPRAFLHRIPGAPGELVELRDRLRLLPARSPARRRG